MLQTLKKAFYALLPSLKKAAEDALRENNQQPHQASDAHTNHSSGSSRNGGAPKPGSWGSKSKSSAAESGKSAARSATASAATDYPGDYHGAISFEYSPSLDGDADPGEIVWTWVPYEEDYTQGKDRPVILVGRDQEYFLALMMTSKDHNNRDHTDANYLDIGSGSWDSQGRASEVKLNRVIRVHPAKMRREGSVLPREIFQRLEQAYNRR